MNYKIQGRVEGLDALVSQLRALDQKVRKKAVRGMVSKGGQILSRAAKAKSPRETGLLRKSIGSKVKVYLSGVAVSIVGPRQGFRQEVRRKKGRRTPKVELANPIKYAHLLELGTRTASAKPFLRPAFAASQAAIKEAMAKVVQQALGLGGG